MRYESKFERKKASNINNKNKKKRKNSLNLPFCFHRSHHHQDDGNLFFREEKNSMIIIDDKKSGCYHYKHRTWFNVFVVVMVVSVGLNVNDPIIIDYVKN